MRVRRRALLGLVLSVCLFGTGCLTRHVRQDVFDRDGVEVFLREDKQLFSDVEKGYDHPATIAPVRMAHILSRLDLRQAVKDGNRREPVIPTDVLYPIADGISMALAKAKRNQEVVVMALRQERRLGILENDYLTSFVAYVRGDELFLHVSKSNEFVKDRARRDEQLRQPRVDDEPTGFRLYAGTAMKLKGKNAVAIEWRDPIFKNPTRTKILSTGEVKRKTILFESPIEDDVGEEAPALPDGISPQQLRDLADLEEERRAGTITESEYRSRQQAILQATP